MSHRTDTRQWTTLDRDLRRIGRLEYATHHVSRPLVGVGVSLAFIVLVTLASALLFGQGSGSLVIGAAAAFGAYMALNIGANDVANNMGPAVGANALTLGGAIALAAVCESAGALLAGGDVVSTISRDIVAPESVADPSRLTLAMLAALLSAAIWVNVATWIGAPVSTTHAVVGGVVGAGVAAAGMGAVNWPVMGAIAVSWVISPVMGGVVAALFLALIKTKVIYVDDKIAAARRWVPILIGIMSGAFAIYMLIKGLSDVIEVTAAQALGAGLAVAVLAWLVAVPLIRRQSRGMENRNKSLKTLFGFPLVISAGLLSFAHGANDVANAVGPLAAIVHAQGENSVADQVVIPAWVMVIGAAGISFGLVLFGPRLIRLVGSQITKLNPMRAYCVALSAAITVIAASWLGLPVSSTHIAVGGIFGVGFFREWYLERRVRQDRLERPERALAAQERQRRKLVRRSHFLTIVAAWLVTVPAAAGLSGGIYLALAQLS